MYWRKVGLGVNAFPIISNKMNTVEQNFYCFKFGVTNIEAFDNFGWRIYFTPISLTMHVSMLRRIEMVDR